MMTTPSTNPKDLDSSATRSPKNRRHRRSHVATAIIAVAALVISTAVWLSLVFAGASQPFPAPQTLTHSRNRSLSLSQQQRQPRHSQELISKRHRFRHCGVCPTMEAAQGVRAALVAPKRHARPRLVGREAPQKRRRFVLAADHGFRGHIAVSVHQPDGSTVGAPNLPNCLRVLPPRPPQRPVVPPRRRRHDYQCR
ncbi:uncharacterized protein Pyn_40458 [Prunus yedoensis var. nudiflora]|uniref:Uncharacterized protein n=1 Tax=Prunus yedoensis var. nudiflora TaxID=2094558 RepID=A0A314XUF0_PRUYE|nr:uncharacterized protein Pyn_40458 [Prunus yedoensis var. nudiflora]